MTDGDLRAIDLEISRSVSAFVAGLIAHGAVPDGHAVEVIHVEVDCDTRMLTIRWRDLADNLGVIREASWALPSRSPARSAA